MISLVTCPCISFLFHVNACFFKKSFDGLDHLLKSTNKAFDIIAVNETRITKQISLTSNIILKCYLEFTPTKSLSSKTLLYMANHLSYKPRHDPKV